MLAIPILFFIVLPLLIVYLYNKSKERPENFPPGPPRLPFWGSYLSLLKENYNYLYLSLEALGKKYETDIVGFFLGDFASIAVLSYDLCKEVLVRDEFIGRPETIITRARSMDDSKGVIFIDGPFWKDQRRFALRHMRDFGFGRRSETVENYIADEVKYLIDFLNSESAKNTDPDVCKGKGLVLMPDLLYGPTLNTILLILCSTRFDNYKLREIGRAGLRFQKSHDATGSTITFAPWLRHLAPDFFGYTSVIKDNGYMLDFLKEVVDEHVKTFSDDHHRDFIDDFLSETYREGYDLDYKQLLMTVLDFMFPSPSAAGQTLGFYFAYLINNPQVQIKIQEEIDRVVGRSRLPNLDDRKSLPYLEASIREIIRVLTLVPMGIPRRCVKDTMLGGYFIPENTIVFPCLYTAHRDKAIWKDPEMFQPERFLDGDGNLLKKDLTIGFGAGKRLCAGETFARNIMFLLAAGILQNFTIKSPSGGPVDMGVVPGLILSLQENWILAVPR